MVRCSRRPSFCFQIMRDAYQESNKIQPSLSVAQRAAAIINATYLTPGIRCFSGNAALVVLPLPI